MQSTLYSIDDETHFQGARVLCKAVKLQKLLHRNLLNYGTGYFYFVVCVSDTHMLTLSTEKLTNSILHPLEIT